ncbi:MAG TPA: hypothetical protein VKW78_08890 [Terriglobales bacterium]|nr:hypothetical protein [Terriglobales bacterium]
MTGTIHQVNSDFSNPREKIVYFYPTESGYHSGFFWRWFDASDMRIARVHDATDLRYAPPTIMTGLSSLASTKIECSTADGAAIS